MAIAERYASRLAEQLRRGPRTQSHMSLRAILNGLGHTRRTKAVVASVHQILGAHGLSVDFTVDRPPTLDDQVAVALAPLQRAIEPVAAAEVLRPAIDLTAAADRALSATIEVRLRPADGDSSGTGFVIHADGLAVTACHVVTGERGIVRRLAVRTAKRKRGMASVVAAHPKLDFALLWLDVPGPHRCLSIGDPRTLRAAEQVVAVGHLSFLDELLEVGTLRSTVTTGTVANPAAAIHGVEWIQMNTDIDPGNSGGPLVNAAGQVVGVNVWKYPDLGAGKMALPIDYLLDDIERNVRLGKPAAAKGWLCPLCGWRDLGRKRWFCLNCGVPRGRWQK